MEKGEGGGVRSVCLRGGGPQPPVISISRRTGATVQWSSSGRRSVCTHASTHTINTQIYIISIICVSVNQSSPFTTFFFLSFLKKKKLRLLLLGHLSAPFSASRGLFLICLVTKLLQKNMKG